MSNENVVQIRKTKREVTREDLIESGAFTAEQMDVIHRASQDGTNIIVVGSLGSGKTTIQNYIVQQNLSGRHVYICKDASEFDMEFDAKEYANCFPNTDLIPLNNEHYRETYIKALSDNDEKVIVERYGKLYLDEHDEMSVSLQGDKELSYKLTDRELLPHLLGVDELPLGSYLVIGLQRIHKADMAQTGTVIRGYISMYYNRMDNEQVQ